MKSDKELGIVENDDDLDEEDFDDEEFDEMDDYSVSVGVKGFLAGVMVGALVGAGVALLMAPDRGEVVRRRIGRTWRDFQDDARDQLGDWRGEARREVKRQRRRLKRKLNRVTRD